MPEIINAPETASNLHKIVEDANTIARGDIQAWRNWINNLDAAASGRSTGGSGRVMDDDLTTFVNGLQDADPDAAPSLIIYLSNGLRAQVRKNPERGNIEVYRYQNRSGAKMEKL